MRTGVQGNLNGSRHGCWIPEALMRNRQVTRYPIATLMLLDLEASSSVVCCRVPIVHARV